MILEILGISASFIVGVLLAPRLLPPPGAPWDISAEDRLVILHRQLARHLRLTEEQARQTFKILGEVMNEMELLHQSVLPRFKVIYYDAQERIEKVLDTNQRSKFRKMHAQMYGPHPKPMASTERDNS